jgi:hypothetical protein
LAASSSCDPSASSLVALGQAAYADLVAGKTARLSEGLDGNFAAVASPLILWGGCNNLNIFCGLFISTTG